MTRCTILTGSWQTFVDINSAICARVTRSAIALERTVDILTNSMNTRCLITFVDILFTKFPSPSRWTGARQILTVTWARATILTRVFGTFYNSIVTVYTTKSIWTSVKKKEEIYYCSATSCSPLIHHLWSYLHSELFTRSKHTLPPSHVTPAQSSKFVSQFSPTN